MFYCMYAFYYFYILPKIYPYTLLLDKTTGVQYWPFADHENSVFIPISCHNYDFCPSLYV